MSAYWPEFLVFAVAHVLSLISPGPDFLMVVQSSLRYSRRTALWVALGISMGEMVHVGYSLLGIGWIITQSLWAFAALKYLGGAYLVYIGFQAVRAQKSTTLTLSENHHAPVHTSDLNNFQAFRLGFLTNALNAKAAFFTISFFTVLVSPQTPMFVQIMYGAFIQISTLLWFGMVAFFLTHEKVQGPFIGVKRWIERTCGAFLIFLGIKLSLSDIESLT